MRVGSLFAGIGGFDLAAQRAGLEVAWSSENNEKAGRVLAARFPEVENLGDIHGIESPPAVDVLTGGFPCQDYSVAGSRGGLAGDRGALWWEYHRLIARLSPTWVIGENVPGLLSSRGGRDLETIIDSLTQLGYGVAWAVLDAQFFGVAQRRRRLFLIGHSGGEPRPEVLALSEGLLGHPPPRREEGSSDTGATPIGIGGGSETAHALTTHSGGLSAKQNQYTFVVEPEAGQGADLKAREVALSSSLTATDGRSHDRGVRVVAFTENQRNEVRELDNVAGALPSTRPGKQQTFVTSPSVRRLTPLEAERLQGFPDGWTEVEGLPPTARFSLLGNAVAVPVAQFILERLTV